LVVVLKAILVVIEYGCEPACVSVEPSLFKIDPSNVEIPKLARALDTATAKTTSEHTPTASSTARLAERAFEGGTGAPIDLTSITSPPLPNA
jgi:hypothetical protein